MLSKKDNLNDPVTTETVRMLIKRLKCEKVANVSDEANELYRLAQQHNQVIIVQEGGIEALVARLATLDHTQTHYITAIEDVLMELSKTHSAEVITCLKQIPTTLPAKLHQLVYRSLQIPRSFLSRYIPVYISFLMLILIQRP